MVQANKPVCAVVVALVVAVAAVPACKGSSSGSGGSIIGSGVRVDRTTDSGAPTLVGSVIVPLTGDDPTHHLMNVVADLNGDGTFASYPAGGDTQDEWVVQNVAVPVTAGTFSFTFYAPDATPLSGAPVKIRVVLVDAPIASATWDGTAPAGAIASDVSVPIGTLALSHPAIGKEGFITGASGVGGWTVLPRDLRPLGDPPAPFPDGTGHIAEPKGQEMPVLGQGPQDCVPHALMNSLVWLARKCKFGDNIAGHDTTDTASLADLTDIVDAIKKTGAGLPSKAPPDPSAPAGTPPQPAFSEAGGTKLIDAFQLKQKFIADNKLPIDSKRIPSGDGDYSGMGSYQAMMDAINNGCAVEAILTIDTSKGQLAPQAHAVAVTGFAVAGGKASITFRDSNNQPTAMADGSRLNDTYPVGGADGLSIDDFPFRRGPGEARPNSYPAKLAYVMTQCCIPQKTSCVPLQSGTYAVSVTSTDDPAGHFQFIGDPFAGPVTFGEDGATIAATGQAPFVNVTGPVAADCSFSATGSGVVAGRSNVSVTMQGTASGTTVTGTYTMGANGELPQAKSATKHFTATKQ